MFTEATLSSFGQDASCHFTPWEEGFSDTKLPFRGARFCWARETAPQKQRRVLLGGFVTSDLSILGSPLPSLGGLAWMRLEVAASVGGLGPHPLPTPSPLSVCAALPASRSVTLPVLVLGEGALLPAGMTVNSRRAWEGAGRTDPQLPPHSAVQVFPCTSHAPSRNPMGHCFGVRTAAV